MKPQLHQLSLFQPTQPPAPEPKVIVNMREAVCGWLVQMERIEVNGDWNTIRQVLVYYDCPDSRQRADTISDMWRNDLQSNPDKFMTAVYDVAYNDRLERQYNEGRPS